MSDAIVSVLQALADVVRHERTLGTALGAIAQLATASVPRCDAASVAISIGGRPATAATTARVALELDLVQYDLDEGPCLATYRSTTRLRIDLLEHGDAFAHFAEAAHKLGVRAVLSDPATWGGDVVGTLNLYSRTGPFDESAEAVAGVLSARVAVAISRSPEFAAARAVVEQAQRDADDDADVNLATGLLMITQACSVAQASGLLHEAANRGGRTTVEAAQRIIEHHRSTR